MNRLVELLVAVNKPNVEFNDAVEFIELAYPMVNSGEVPDRNAIVNCISQGLGPHVIANLLNRLESEPDKYKIEVSKLYNKEGILIKTYCRNGNTEEICADEPNSVPQHSEDSRSNPE